MTIPIKPAKYSPEEVDRKIAAMLPTALTNPDELKQLIEDAARLLGLRFNPANDIHYLLQHFNPLDPVRRDLMKVAEAAELRVDYSCEEVSTGDKNYAFGFARGDHQSLALAVLRAASAVWKERGE